VECYKTVKATERRYRREFADRQLQVCVANKRFRLRPKAAEAALDKMLS
jgi:hypothetical protein